MRSPLCFIAGGTGGAPCNTCAPPARGGIGRTCGGCQHRATNRPTSPISSRPQRRALKFLRELQYQSPQIHMNDFHLTIFFLTGQTLELPVGFFPNETGQPDRLVQRFREWVVNGKKQPAIGYLLVPTGDKNLVHVAVDFDKVAGMTLSAPREQGEAASNSTDIDHSD